MSVDSIRHYGVAFSNLIPGARVPYPDRLLEITDRRPTVAVRRCLEPEKTLDLVVDTLRTKRPSYSGLKADLGITKADVLAYRASFSDMAGVQISPQIASNSAIAKLTIESIERQSQITENTLDVDEQLKLALEASGNDLARAVLGLAVGTRHMARAMDRKVMPPDFELDESRMVGWKRGLAPICGEPSEDTAGNNYHFWEGVVAGMSSDEGCDPKSVASLKARTCRTIHANTARITEVLRYRLNRNTGETHHFADTLGLNVGIALANQTNYEQLLQV